MPPLFQRAISRLLSPGPRASGLFAAWALCRKLEAWKRAPEGARASERLLTCDSCRLPSRPLRALHLERRCWHRPTVCSGIPSLPSLLEWGGLQARPGDPGPRQLGQVSGVLAGRRVQTPDEAGSRGCRGNLASGPGRELGFGGNRAGAACRIPQAPLGAPPPCLPEALAPAVSAAGETAGCGGSRGAPGWLPLSPSFPLTFWMSPLPWGGDGAAPGFLEFSSPGDPAQVPLPRLCGASLHDQCPFPSLSSPPAWMRRGNHC